MARSSSFSVVLLLLFTLAATAVANHAVPSVSVSRECVYSLFVRTGDRPKAGTDAKINITLADSRGQSFVIHDLEKWGLMKPGHRYLEIGNTDFFSVKGKCLTAPVCKIILRSDGTGVSPGWFVQYIKVTQNEPHVPCTDTFFPISKWLGLELKGDIRHAPLELVVVVDPCKKKSQRHQIS